MGKQLGLEMKMHARVAECLNKNNDLVFKYPRLKQEKNVFDTKRTKLGVEIAKKGEVTTGITVGKVDTFKNYGNLLLKACIKGKIWATDNSNPALIAVFTFVTSKYDRLTYAQKLETGKNIYSALNDNLAALLAVDFTADDLAAIADAGNMCEIANIAPSSATGDKKVANNNAIQLSAEIGKNITTMGELIFSHYSDTEPDFLSAYQNASEIETMAVRHTAISATITNAANGKPVENATLIIDSLDKTAISDMAGLAEIIKMKVGSYHISISAEGFATQLMDITVQKGKTLELAIALVVA